MAETWKDIAGFEGRYQVSDAGRVKSLAHAQRYVHWRNGAEMSRTTRERVSATQLINSGYQIVHLHQDNKRTALLVHRLVATQFLEGPQGATVNHKNGVKTDNRVRNLEWATYTENHLHAVAHGLNKQARPATNPATGIRYPSVAQAAKDTRKSHRAVARTFTFESKTCTQ
jgi:hypothetical protein